MKAFAYIIKLFPRQFLQKNSLDSVSFRMYSIYLLTFILAFLMLKKMIGIYNFYRYVSSFDGFLENQNSLVGHAPILLKALVARNEGEVTSIN